LLHYNLLTHTEHCTLQHVDNFVIRRQSQKYNVFFYILSFYYCY